jgi:hypothetical protein
MGDLHDLIELTAEALHERAAYIVDHAETIGVRHEVEPGKWIDLRLTVLAQLNPRAAFREAFRLLLRAEIPHRRVDPYA